MKSKDFKRKSDSTSHAKVLLAKYIIVNYVTKISTSKMTPGKGPLNNPVTEDQLLRSIRPSEEEEQYALKYFLSVNYSHLNTFHTFSF